MKKLPYILAIAFLNSSCLGMFIIPGKAEDEAQKIPKTGAQLTVSLSAKNKLHEGSIWDNPWVENVIAKFESISQEASAKIEASSNGLIPNLYFAQTAKVIEELLLDKLNIKKRMAGLSHFQSIKRVPNTNYVYLDAGDTPNKIAHLFIVQMTSEPKKGVWRSTPSKPNPTDMVIKTIKLHKGADHWHPGGMDICGKYLVIPLEGSIGTTAAFYDISDPLKPVRLAVNIEIPGGCMATALTRLPDDHYLVGTFMNTDRLDLFYSKTTKLEDGFYDTPTVSNVEREASRSNYQNINFVTQTDGTLFMAASQNTENTSPVISGDDYLDLFVIEYDINKFAAINKQLAENKAPTDDGLTAFARCVRQKKFRCGNQCNFNAGATLHIENSNHIAIYATPHWPKDETVRFNVYE